MKADVAFSKVGALVSASSLLLATAVFRYGPEITHCRTGTGGMT